MKHSNIRRCGNETQLYYTFYLCDVRAAIDKTQQNLWVISEFQKTNAFNSVNFNKFLFSDFEKNQFVSSVKNFINFKINNP